eukprot:1821032-Prymnesium_polylepis.1
MRMSAQRPSPPEVHCALSPALSHRLAFATVRLTRYFKRFELYSRLNPALLRLFQLFLFWVIAVHWVACVWVAVGDAADTKSLPPRAFILDGDRDNIGVMYLEAIYWAVMMTTGLGVEFMPTTASETLYELFVCVMGVAGYAAFLGAATSAVSQADVVSAKRKARLSSVQQFVRRRALPLWLRTRLLNFYSNSLTRQQALEEITSLNEELPSELKLQLDIVVYSKLLIKARSALPT